MATKRNVKSMRAVYMRKPGPTPKKQGIRASGESIKLGVKVLLAGLAVFGLWRFFAVSEIEVKGNAVIPRSEIEAEINTSFAHHHFSKNLLTLGLAPLVDDLMQDQRIGEVSVRRKWPNKIVATVVERQLSIVWVSAGKSYLLDNNGVAVGQLNRPSKGLPVITDSTGLPVSIGGHIVPQRFVEFAGRIAGELTPQTKLAVVSLSVPDTTTELDVKTTAGYVVKFDASSRAEDQLLSLKTVLATLVKLKKVPSQYIDLRIPGKAYYL